MKREELGESKTAADGKLLSDDILQTHLADHAGSGEYTITTTRQLLDDQEKVITESKIVDEGTRSLVADETHNTFSSKVEYDSVLDVDWHFTKGWGLGTSQYSVSGKITQNSTFPPIDEATQYGQPYFESERNYTNTSAEDFTIPARRR